MLFMLFQLNVCPGISAVQVFAACIKEVDKLINQLSLLAQDNAWSIVSLQGDDKRLKTIGYRKKSSCN